MEKTGLTDNIATSATLIARGRKSMTIDGEERDGRINFEKGHALARQTYQEALASGDAEIVLLLDYFFLSGELAESDGNEPEGKASAEAALHSFDDAFLALEAVEEGAAYRIAEKVIPHSAQHHYRGLPKDAFHIACIAHKTRLKNGLSRLGLPTLDRELAKTRIAALGAIQQVYGEKQQAALSKDEGNADYINHEPHEQKSVFQAKSS